MAARHHARRDPLPSEGGLCCPNSLWCAPGRIVEHFIMEQPIPPYLFAFAVGHIVFHDIGPRTRVYAGPDVVDEAAREFAGTEEMIRAREKLFGPYDWERFDLLVLPMSFPYGGMENPRMVFLTPTVIKGDAAGAQVVAHELAHSWTGNLITNKTNEDFWLNEVAKELTKKCGGLPLALIVLGGILSTKERTYSAWQRVNATLDWHNGGAEQCSQVLFISYTDMPYLLKLCFLYFASFPEDYQISAKHVIRMWMAEGFIPQDGKGTMEDRAEEFLEELVQRCLVQVIKKSWNGNSKLCHMHDLLRDMATHEAREEIFSLYSQKQTVAASRLVKWCVAQHYNIPNLQSLASIQKRFLPCSVLGSMYQKYHGFRLLRVLTIEHVIMPERFSYREWLEGLIHLRYFGLRYCVLPDDGFERISFSSLKNLEIVDCKGTWFRPVSCINKINSALSLWEVQTLRHVVIDLTVYPHLPSKWDHLKNIQTLKWVRLEDFTKLEYNINLRALRIQIWKRGGSVAVSQGCQTLKDLLKRTDHLVSLAVEVIGGSISFFTEGTSGLPCHKKIQCLYLKGEWPRDVCVPSIEMLQTNLTKLTLVCSKLEQDPMPILERLQSLRILRLWEDSFVGTELTCTKEGFPMLQKLELGGLQNLSHWEIKMGSMPRLSHLQIYGCSQLHELPELQNVPTLQHLRLDRSLHERTQAKDHYKVKHIPSVLLTIISHL